MPDYVMKYLVSMRKCNYYSQKYDLLSRFKYTYNRSRMHKLGVKLGFSIGYKVFGYGLVLPHHGTIVVGGSNNIGNYAVLHTSTCITDNGKLIGDALYLSTGAKITSPVQLGNNVSVAANSLVNKTFLQDNILIAGAPAKLMKLSEPWYVRDGEQYMKRVEAVESLRVKMEL